MKIETLFCTSHWNLVTWLLPLPPENNWLQVHAPHPFEHGQYPILRLSGHHSIMFRLAWLRLVVIEMEMLAVCKCHTLGGENRASLWCTVFFPTNQGQDLKPSAAPLYPNMSHVPPPPPPWIPVTGRDQFVTDLHCHLLMWLILIRDNNFPQQQRSQLFIVFLFFDSDLKFFRRVSSVVSFNIISRCPWTQAVTKLLYLH